MRYPRNVRIVLLALLGVCSSAAMAGKQDPNLPYRIVDTGQVRCYNDRHEIEFPDAGERFYGQDAQFAGNAPTYRNNGDGTISDLVTGLMWQADPGEKVTYARAVKGAKACRTGGYADWRLPTIKELYSLIRFSGTDPDPRSSTTRGMTPFLDTRYFKFSYGKQADGDRLIDSQWATSTVNVDKVMGNRKSMFGVNFADGRIKAYPTQATPRRQAKTFFVIYVRGNEKYGRNEFIDNKDGTITDRATGLMWMKLDSGGLKAGKSRDGRLTWEQALQWAEDLKYAGYDDWRLPNAKELQSIVDYSRSPGTTRSPAIDPVFRTTQIKVEQGRKDYPFFLTSTTHAGRFSGHQAAYIAFGRSYGYMQNPRTGRKQLMDVHGAGSQRSDPKSGDPDDLPQGHGPQGDVQRILNFARLVRSGQAKPRTDGPKVEMTAEVVRRNARGRGGQPEGNPRERFIERLDRDGDGKVSRKEFDGPKGHFRDFDRNGDGYISSSEAPTGPPRRKR